MAGMSYVGATQWLAAAAAPPALQGIAPTMSSDDYAEGWSYTGGVPELGFLATWSAIDLAPFESAGATTRCALSTTSRGSPRIAPWSAEWLHGERSRTTGARARWLTVATT